MGSLHEKAAPPGKDLPTVWSPFFVAKEMGAVLGRGPLLFGAVQARRPCAALVGMRPGQAGRFLCRFARKRLRRLCWFIFNRRFFFRLPMDDSCQVRLADQKLRKAGSFSAGKSIP